MFYFQENSTRSNAFGFRNSSGFLLQRTLVRVRLGLTFNLAQRCSWGHVAQLGFMLCTPLLFMIRRLIPIRAISAEPEEVPKTNRGGRPFSACFSFSLAKASSCRT